MQKEDQLMKNAGEEESFTNDIRHPEVTPNLVIERSRLGAKTSITTITLWKMLTMIYGF